MRFLWVILTVLSLLPANAAVRTFDFGGTTNGLVPPGWRSVVSGPGKPGTWRVTLEEAPSALAPLNAQAPSVSKMPVVTQTSRDKVEDRFALLVYEPETYQDFTITTRFKIVEGDLEQMAGLVFRYQDVKNYYYVRASALGTNFNLFRVVNGELLGPTRAKVEVSLGTWHTMSVVCRGALISCSLDGNPLIPELTLDNFPRGKIGFWTKADSVCQFAETRIDYVPREAPAQVAVQQTLKQYPRLVGMRIYVSGDRNGEPRIVGSKDPADVGQTGGANEQDVISNGKIYTGKDKDKGTISVTMPLRDRNGDNLAAVRLVMKSFLGQTEQNALARAMPIVKDLQARVQSIKDLAD